MLWRVLCKITIFCLTSDILYLMCIRAWEVYQLITDSIDRKSYFSACEMQKPVFTTMPKVMTGIMQFYIPKVWI